MADHSGKDPFTWDTDDLVRELCTPNRTWDAQEASKLPDPAQLEKAIRELDLDGQTLLQWEFLMGENIPQDLGIKKAPQKIAIRKAIKIFQSRSQAFRQWKREQDAEQDAEKEDGMDDSAAGSRYASAPPNQPGNEALTPQSNFGPSYVPGQPNLGPTWDAPEDPGHQVPMPVAGLNPSHVAPALPSLDRAPHHPSAPAPETTEPPQKKQKRIAPTIISTAVGASSAFIPTEADGFGSQSQLKIAQNGDSIPADQDSRDAYLGPHGYLLILPNLQEDDDKTMAFTGPPHAGPGRQQQANKAVKAYLYRGARTGLDTQGGTDPKDVLLPLLGDSDEEYDDQTWAEMEAEERERVARLHKKQFLTPDEIKAALDEAIADFELDWDATKKPALELKAYKLWTNARRFGRSKFEVIRAAGRIRHLNDRITKACNDIYTVQYGSKAEVRRQVGSIERSLEDRRHFTWLRDLYATATAPRKPSALPRPPPRVRNRRPKNPDEDEESLGSESEDDFVVPDDPMGLDDPMNMVFDDSDDSSILPELGDAQLPIAADDAMEWTESVPASPDRRGVPLSVVTALVNPPPVEGQITPEEALTPLSQLSNGYDLTGPETPQRATFPRLSAQPATKIGSRYEGKGSTAEDAIEIGSSPSSSDEMATPLLENSTAIANKGLKHWETRKDRERLVIALLARWTERDSIFAQVDAQAPDELWKTAIEAAMTNSHEPESTPGRVQLAFRLARLFQIFISCSAEKKLRVDGLDAEDIAQIQESSHEFSAFHSFLKQISGNFSPSSASKVTKVKLRASSSPRGSPTPSPPQLNEAAALSEQLPTGDSSSDGDIDDDDEEDGMPISPSKKRYRKLSQNREAKLLRQNVRQQQEEQEIRRKALRQNIANTGSVPMDKSRLIINESKKDDEGLIFINEEIGRRIKNHQIEGVRFMWNRIVGVNQGCLLAHTMGLGKTMQVITFLVAIVEAAESPDDSISSQIPEDLRDNAKILVLSPPGLVDNWLDELLLWTPKSKTKAQTPSILGGFWKLDRTLNSRGRIDVIREWAAAKGGILVIGYQIFAKFAKPTATDEEREIFDLLLQKPDIVVSDETHVIKNPGSQVHEATANFATRYRIAMTGSPLANNVLDYYAMINWAYPTYLSDLKEFKAHYANPIAHGLYADSTGPEKRKALKRLGILKETVAPVVHRMGILALKDDLPDKMEFVIYLPLTELQRTAYIAYTKHVLQTPEVREQMRKSGRDAANAMIWSYVNIMAALLAHPHIYRTYLKGRLADLQKFPGGKKPAKAAKAAKALGDAPDDNEPEGDPSLSRQALGELISTVNVRGIEDTHLSWKIVILNAILDEARRLKEKVLVFSQYLPTLNFLEAMFSRQKRRFSRLDGNTPVPKRQSAIKHFNTDPDEEIYLISTKAGGVGLNIFGASRVVIFDFKYVPSDEQQAVGRAFRLGQTKPVFVYWLIVDGTFENTIHNKSVFKMQLSSRVVDKKNPLAWSKRTGDYFAQPKTPPKEDLKEWVGNDKIMDNLIKSPGNEGIIRLMMTETFEQEDPDDSVLTPEDRQEMQQWVHRNQLRKTNPEEYDRTQAQWEAQQRDVEAQPQLQLSAEAEQARNHNFPPVNPPKVTQTTTAATGSAGPSHIAEPSAAEATMAVATRQAEDETGPARPPETTSLSRQEDQQAAQLPMQLPQQPVTTQAGNTQQPEVTQTGKLPTYSVDCLSPSQKRPALSVPSHLVMFPNPNQSPTSQRYLEHLVQQPVTTQPNSVQQPKATQAEKRAMVPAPGFPVSYPLTTPPAWLAAIPSSRRDHLPKFFGASAFPTQSGVSSVAGPSSNPMRTPVADHQASTGHKTGKIGLNVMKGGGSETLRGKKDQYRKRLTVVGQKLLREGRPLSRPVGALMAAAEAAVDAMSSEILMQLDHWGTLNLLARTDRMVEAIIGGHQNVAALLTMQRTDATRTVEELKDMPDDEFNRLVWGVPPAADTLESRLQRTAARSPSTSSAHSRDDMAAMQSVLDRRASRTPGSADRKPRLPEWAKSELRRLRPPQIDGQAQPGDSADLPHVLE